MQHTLSNPTMDTLRPTLERCNPAKAQCAHPKIGTLGCLWNALSFCNMPTAHNTSAFPQHNKLKSLCIPHPFPSCNTIPPHDTKQVTPRQSHPTNNICQVQSKQLFSLHGNTSLIYLSSTSNHTIATQPHYHHQDEQHTIPVSLHHIIPHKPTQQFSVFNSKPQNNLFYPKQNQQNKTKQNKSLPLIAILPNLTS